MCIYIYIYIYTFLSNYTYNYIYSQVLNSGRKLRTKGTIFSAPAPIGAENDDIKQYYAVLLETINEFEHKGHAAEFEDDTACSSLLHV